MRLGCNIDGNLNEAKFSEPLPWIGLYIAAASLACLIAMAADSIHGFHQRKLWFPCKFFSLNSASLTLISITTKLSVDLNTSMPSREDQLSKLSSVVLMIVMMCSTMPSLGTMENKEIFSNITALVILVITLLVNICIQLGTGVIYVFWKEYAFVMFLMAVLLLMFCFSALAVQTTKHYLEFKYKTKLEIALKEISNGNDNSVVDRIRENLMKYWMMAHTASPQYVMGRSVMCTASGAICLMSAATLAEAMFRAYLMPWPFKFCSGDSDYKWSVNFVLVIQTVAVVVGTVGPAFRWSIAIKFRCPKRGKDSYKTEFKVEKYWIHRLVEMKESPLSFRIQNRQFRKIAHDMKDWLMYLCIRTQVGIVVTSKIIRLISILFFGWVLLCFDFCKKMKNKLIINNSISNSKSVSDPDQIPARIDLSQFVLHLEGEDGLAHLMIKRLCDRDATEHWIQEGQKRQPQHLLQLLEVSKNSRGFQSVREFDYDQVSPLDIEEPPNCWALPLITLTTIAIILPNRDGDQIKQLIRGVNEGLVYVNLIEDHLDITGDLTNVRKAANVVWKQVDLYNKWLDLDLRKLSLQKRTPREVLEELRDTAKKNYTELKKRYYHACLKSPSHWPVNVLAANSMYRISQTLLIMYERRCEMTDDKLIVMISNTLCGCLTNLKRHMCSRYLKSAIEEREDSVREAVYILGKTENILKLLEEMEIPDVDSDGMMSIDEWRRLVSNQNNESLVVVPGSVKGNVDCFDTIEFYLNID